MNVARSHWFLLFAVIGFAIAARLAYPAGIAVEHFDEGVYASELWFGPGTEGHYPQRHFYAPPLLPLLIETTLVLDFARAPSTAPGRLTPIIPNLAAAVALLGLIWWSMRVWFGAGPALAAVCLAAGSDFHILYSRTALTDVLLVTWLLAAVVCFERGVAGRRWGLVAASGVATAAAWWTKYNGWLPLAIAVAAVGLGLLAARNRRDCARFWAAAWLMAAAVAVLLWSPYLVLLQEEGGYGAIAANHRQYLVGWGGWWDGLLRQAGNINAWDSPLTLASLLLASLAAGRASDGNWSAQARHGALGLALAGTAALVGSALLIFAMAIGGGIHLARRVPSELAAAPARLPPGLLLLSWFVGLLLATPLYSPYPRLALPWLCSGWLLAAIGLVRLQQAIGATAAGRSALATPALAAAGILLMMVQPAWLARPRVWQPRTGLARAAEQVDQATSDSEQRIVFVYGEPALYYHLAAQRRGLIVPVAGLGFVESLPPNAPPAYLVAGLHAARSEQFARQLQRHAGQLQPKAEWHYRPSDLVLQDQGPLRQDADSGARIQLWQVVPAAAAASGNRAPPAAAGWHPPSD